MGESKVVIVGGGLAGMTVARELAEQGLAVRIIEASPRLGGKATAHRADSTGQWEDHGYHIFPGWYVNTRRLLRELGCDKYLVDFHRFHWLRRGEFPRLMTMLELSSLPNIWHNLNVGVMPFPEMLLSGYFLIDLLSQPFRHRFYLDRISVAGFLRSRFYASDRIAKAHHQFTLQAGSIPYYELSAMTLQKIFNGWGKVRSPNLSILSGNLREYFIAPLEDDLRHRSNVEIHCDQEVVRIETDGARISRLWLRGGQPVPGAGADDLYVLCIPHGRAHALVNSDVYRSERESGSGNPDDQVYLSDLFQLRSAPMAAWHVRMKRRIPGIPREHVNCADSRYGISFIDISQTWSGLDTTVLNCIAAYYEPLSQLSKEQAEDYLLAELLEYLPGVSRDDIAVTYLQPHMREPLFLNTLAAWTFRPKSTTGVANLFMAGDYCRSEADLTTMESAIGSALRAAKAVLESTGRRARITELKIPALSRWMMVLAKYLALPLVAPLALWLKLQSSQEQTTSGK